MPSNYLMNQGEKLTLYQLFENNNWNIEIPIIQRDYAQGRPSASEIRRNFVLTLLEHLQSNKNIDLDFVYGSLKEGDNSLFVPLDGQQRLTTLFLLHWYLANKEFENDDFKKCFFRNAKSRFTYETRISSKEFCDSLVANGLDFDTLINDSVSETIEDQFWFFYSWKDDPTINSMLIMLDEIHRRFKDTSNLYHKLININDPIITFQFLNLDSFKLTDDLYIKMNARGKQLTLFENFKAKIEEHIKELEFESDVSYFLDFDSKKTKVSVREYFSHKIDTDWANLFWNYKNSVTYVFDEQLMNFIRICFANSYAISHSESLFQRILASKSIIPFSAYKKHNCLEPRAIINLISYLDLLKNGNGEIHCYLNNDDYWSEVNLFNKAITNSLTYTERLRFHAQYQYLILQEGDTTNLEAWVRVVHNLTENTIYNVLEEFVAAINSLEKLLEQSSDILNYLSSTTGRIRGFLESQVIEERIKACLILKDDKWRSQILKMEKHGYFKGQISFLLNFSGVEDYYNHNKNCDWDSEQNDKFLSTFILYSSKAASVFNNDGLLEFEDSSFERALFTKGDYTLVYKSNHSFLVNNERDISWKRFMRDDNLGKRKYLKFLFDDILFDKNNVLHSLKGILKTSNVNDWRKNFIDLPELFGYFGNARFFRKLSPSDINLFKKERLSASHAEYYSYSFYLKYLKGKEQLFSPFVHATYFDIAGDNISFARLGGWRFNGNTFAMNIAFLASKSHFRIRFLEINQNEIPEQIISILNSFDFEKDDKSYILLIENDSLAHTFISEMCNDFSNLS